MSAILVAIFGGLGAVARAEVAERYGDSRGVVIANLTGAALLGLMIGMVGGETLGPGFGRVIGIGFAGGYTTFSTWIVAAAVDPAKHGPRLVGQLLAGIAAAGLGWTLGWLIPF